MTDLDREILAMFKDPVAWLQAICMVVCGWAILVLLFA